MRLSRTKVVIGLWIVTRTQIKSHKVPGINCNRYEYKYCKEDIGLSQEGVTAYAEIAIHQDAKYDILIYTKIQLRYLIICGTELARIILYKYIYI